MLALIFLFFIVPTAIVATMVVLGPSFSPCGNEVQLERKAPTGRIRAIAFSRNCGATTGFSTHVSVVEVGVELPDEGGNLLVVGGRSEIDLVWEAPTRLHVTHQGGEVLHQAAGALGVSASFTSR